MSRGFTLAYQQAPEWDDLRDRIKWEVFDDGGRPEVARRFAEEHYTNPDVLAVVGHATSSTTKLAQEFYRKAGIPLLMPIATSPVVCGGAANCFRLPQPDHTGQAPAISNVLRELNAQNVYLLWDSRSDARGYAEPLFGAVRDLVSGVRVQQRQIGDDTIFTEITQTIKDQRADTVVFVGYGTTAVELIGALRRAFPEPASRPRLVLSDGCRIRDLDVRGFEAYLTFPAPDGPPAPILPDLFSGDEGASPSYEIFGYDSALILATAITRCVDESVLSRRCIRETLSDPQLTFDGAWLKYRFVDGDNILTPYYVYSNVGGGEGEAGAQLQVIRQIEPYTLNALRGAAGRVR